LSAEFVIPGAAAEIVGNCNIIATLGQVQRRWPATVTITAKNENAHRFSLMSRVCKGRNQVSKLERKN
jgi:hypothetical protein